MSTKIPLLIPAVLIKIFAFAGFVSAAILLINAAKRAGIIPTSPFTQLAAPLAQVTAIALVIGIYLLISHKATWQPQVPCFPSRHSPASSGWSLSSTLSFHMLIKV